MEKRKVFILNGIIFEIVMGILIYRIQKEKMLKIKRERDKYFEMFLLMNTWVDNQHQGKKIVNYLNGKGFQSIAIYGMGYIGKRLYEELRREKIEIKYLLDQNKNIHIDDIFIKGIDDDIGGVDIIIVTAIYDFEEIKAMLKVKCECPVISLSDIIYKM